MIKRIFIIIFISVFVLSLNAQVDRTKRPEAGPAPEIELGEYESFTLDNGLKVFVVENDKLPVISFSLVVDRDPIIEGEHAGYVSIAGGLLRTGTETRTKDQLDEEIDFIGARLSTSSTGVYASSLKKHTNTLLEIMSDVVLNSRFTQEELDKLKLQTLSGLQAEKDDPNAIASNVRKALNYGKDHPYGEQVTEETVESITLEMCKEYYQKYFKPNASYLAVVGNISKDEAEDLVKKYFGEWKKNEIPSFTYEDPKAPEEVKVALVDRPSAVQSAIHFTYPLEFQKGDEQEMAAIVLNTMLGGYFSSRLNQNLRETKAYTYGAGSSLAPDELTGHFTASLQARNEVTDSAITEIMKEMDRFRNEEVNEQELSSTKNYITGAFARSLESPQTIATFAINIERYNLPKDYYKNYLKNIESVTAADLKSAADRFIKPDKANIVVVGKADDIKNNLAKFGPITFYDIYGNEADTSIMPAPAGMTGNDVLDKYIEAIGGIEDLKIIQDRTTKMEGEVQNIPITITAYQKEPNLLKQVIKAGAMEQAIIFNGEKGVMQAGGQNMEITGDELEKLKFEASLAFLLNYKSRGVNAELKGIEKISDQDAYKIILTLPSGTKWTQYFSSETGLKLRELKIITTPQGSFTQTSDYSDYREVKGVKYPYSIKQTLGPQKIELKVTSLEVNMGMDESLFEIE